MTYIVYQEHSEQNGQIKHCSHPL